MPPQPLTKPELRPNYSSPPGCAPTAQSIPAWGKAPGMAELNRQGLKARPIAVSIPQVAFVAFHTIFLEKRTELILKRHLSMMRFLPVNVTNQRLQIRRPDRERTISSLPRKFRKVGRL